MKINTDLRQAIRSAINVLQQQNSTGERQRGEALAIETLLSNSKMKARVQAARRDLNKAKELTERAGKFYESIGLYPAANFVRDYKKFVAAGGELPPTAKVPRFDFDHGRRCYRD